MNEAISVPVLDRHDANAYLTELPPLLIVQVQGDRSSNLLTRWLYREHRICYSRITGAEVAARYRIEHWSDSEGHWGETVWGRRPLTPFEARVLGAINREPTRFGPLVTAEEAIRAVRRVLEDWDGVSPPRSVARA